MFNNVTRVVNTRQKSIIQFVEVIKTDVMGESDTYLKVGAEVRP